MLDNLGTVVQNVIAWCGQVVSALFSTGGSWSAIMPFVYLGIAVTLVMTGVHVVKSFTFGRG